MREELGDVSTKSGVLLPVVVVVGAIVLFGGSQVVDTVTDFLGDLDGGGAEVVGEGDTRVLIASEAKPEADQCMVRQMIDDRRCGDLKVLVVNTRKMPFIARNTKLAWESGLPGILTANRGKQQANRAQACPRSFPRPHGGQCDEYPMASTDEGGKQARTEEVPPRENACQGPSYRDQYPSDGERFLVIISEPNLIATEPYAGVDVAKDQGWC